MTTHSAVLAAPSGLTLTAKLFTLADPDTVYKTAGSVTYRTNATAQAVASFADVAAGDYTMIYFSGSRAVAIGYRTFSGTDGETATETPVAVELDSSVTAQLDAIEDNTDASVGYLTTLVNRITSNAATGLANLFAMITGSGASAKFTELALENAPAGGAGEGGGLTEAQDQTLTGIAGAVARLRGAVLNWVGNVGPGGVLELTIGDDHESVIENDLPIRVKDAGGLLFDRLTAAGTTLQWSAGQDTTGGMITGTVGTPTHDDETEITTIIVQVPNCSATGNILAPYKWQLQRTVGGKRARELKGTLNLIPDMIGD
jgi:hypothetical protein